MNPVLIRSIDAGAPTLSGTVGALISVLDFALVTTLGWTKPFTGTNRASYRAPSGVRDYLDINDNAPNATALAKNAYALGFETMTAVGTGTQQFPSAAQITAAFSDFAWGKSNTADGTARPWFILGDDRGFYFVCAATSTSFVGAAWSTVHYFGEIYSHKASDTDRTIITGNINTGFSGAGILQCYGTSGPGAVTIFQQVMKRSYSGSGNPIWATCCGNGHSNGNSNEVLRGAMPYPDPVDGGFRVNKVWVVERGTGSSPTGMTAIRGRLRSAYQIFHADTAFADFDQMPGSGPLAGKTLLLLKFSGIGNTPTIAIEYGSAWEVGS